MFGTELINPLYYLTKTTDHLAATLAVLALVVAVALVVRRKSQRKVRLAGVLAGVAVALGLIAWNLYSVINAAPEVHTVHGPLGDLDPANDYLKLVIPHSSEFAMFAAGVITVVLLCVSLYFHLKTTRTLAALALTFAFFVASMVTLDLVRYQYDMATREWNTLTQILADFWSILFVLVCVEAVVAVAVLSSRAGVRKTERKTKIFSAVPAGTEESTTVR